MLSGLDSSVLNDEFKRIFGFYGEIKEVSLHCWFLPVLVACIFMKIIQDSLNVMFLIADL